MLCIGESPLSAAPMSAVLPFWSAMLGSTSGLRRADATVRSSPLRAAGMKSSGDAGGSSDDVEEEEEAAATRELSNRSSGNHHDDEKNIITHIYFHHHDDEPCITKCVFGSLECISFILSIAKISPVGGLENL